MNILCLFIERIYFFVVCLFCFFWWFANPLLIRRKRRRRHRKTTRLLEFRFILGLARVSFEVKTFFVFKLISFSGCVKTKHPFGSSISFLALLSPIVGVFESLTTSSHHPEKGCSMKMQGKLLYMVLFQATAFWVMEVLVFKNIYEKFSGERISKIFGCVFIKRRKQVLVA